MISGTDIQSKYIKLYENLRNYIWDFDTVELIAELEIAVYDAFPDMKQIQNIFNKLYQQIRYDIEDDDVEFKNAIQAFKDAIQNIDTFYLKLNQVKEVVQK